MAYRVWIDGFGAFPAVRADPLDPPEQRSGHRGPFADRELMDELTLHARARCVAAGYPQAAGGSRNSWHLSLQVPRRDGPVLVAALRAYLEDLNEQPLRDYIERSPHVRSRPAVGESWELV